MAEFSLGLTKTAVEGTLSLVKSAVEEEKKLKEKVQNDLMFISDEFEIMRSFLRVANNKKNDDQVVLTLVRQLRTLAFDVEDCVEHVIHLDLNKSSHWGWLRRLWQTVNCHAPPLPLDDAVAEIQRLKARVEDVSYRHSRYNLILHDSSSSSNNNTQHQPATVTPLLAEEPPYATTTYDPSSTAFHVLRDAWKATGKWSNDMCNLQQELLIATEGEGDHDLQVISVWGITSNSGGGGADLGRASIFRKAYCDSQICEKFRSRAWVKLTHPVNHDEFVKSLVTQLCATSHQENAEFTEGNLMRAKKAMMQQMRRQRYLVVLEDVLTVAEWDVIRMYLPDSKNGSRILLSTPQLGIALLCTGEPYQVSELRKFSGDNQFLCAVSRKEKTAREIGEFVHQLLRRRGVVSVWGADDDDKSNLVDVLYKGIINGWLEEIEGVADKSDNVDMSYKGIRNRSRFEWHSSWVDVPDPFNLKVFAQRLFLNFHSDNIRASKIIEVGMKGDKGLIQWCREFLSEEKDYHYVVVINGVQSKGDWDLIQSEFFSSKATTAKRCILVITKEETVATHCVEDHTYLSFNAKDLEVDPSISTLINKGCWHYAIRGKKGRLIYDRRKDAQEWANKFKNVGGINPDEGKDEEAGFRVFTVTVDKICGKGQLSLPYKGSERGVLRHAYYGALFQQQIERSSWVDVPVEDLDLRDFSWNLLLDFYSDDPRAKEAAAVGLMEGTIIDPIEKCREILRNEKCLVVINGVWSEPVWDSIKHTFFSEQHIQSTIIVGSSPSFHLYRKTKALRLGTHEQCRLIDMEYRRIFSTQKRYKKAIQWVETCQPIGRDWEVNRLAWNLSCPLSVWGISGVGKSTLVRTVYYNEILDSSVLDESQYSILCYQAFGWVDVPSPFDLIEFAWRLFLDFYYDDPQAMETAAVSMMEEGCQVPILECCKILYTRKCLVVMDGLRSKQDWDLIKATFLAEPIKATIVVITNEEEVAMHCAQNNKRRAINVTRLEANATLSLFEKVASKDTPLFAEERLKVFKSIADKCGGLPKVIAAIGACNSSYDTLWSLRDNFMGTLERDQEFHGLRTLFSWMQSYFDACSDSIKPCIFYLSIFSAEKNIRLRRLLWRWIAEGYCRDTSDGRTCEENGENFISELVNLSIIQESACSSKVFFGLKIISSEVFCQINGFFHEYIISRPMEDNLVFALEGRCSLNSTRAGQHLTIRRSWDRNKIVYESIDFSRLRSLTVFGKWEPFFIRSENVKMSLLRVLDLEDATDVTNEDLEQIAKLLTRLKFLSLRGCREITRLPSSIGGLRQLQTLDVRHTCVVMLPPVITKLHKLQYIRAGTTTEVWDWEGVVLLQPLPLPADEEDRASASSSAQGGRDSTTSSSAQVTAAATIGATPNEGGTNSMAPVVPRPDAGLSVSCYNRCRTLLPSLLCRRGGLGNGSVTVPTAGAGVMVPADIGKLSVLHTLGVVKVNAQCSKAIFQELKKLTQLRKLSVSGINKGNIHEFCGAISGHAHLKSLSVELNKDDDLDDNIPHPPKTIKSLKLYGRVHKLLPVWMKHLKHNYLEKLHLTIEKPEELRDQPGILLSQPDIYHLRIRPIQDGELHIGPRWKFTSIVEIQCSSQLHIKFYDRNRVYFHVRVLKVHFSGGSQSSLQISGLSELWNLKEVWFKGYTDEHKQYMQRQIDDMELWERNQERPVLKLVQPRST